MYKYRIYLYPKEYLLQDWMLFFSVVQIGRPFKKWLEKSKLLDAKMHGMGLQKQ